MPRGRGSRSHGTRWLVVLLVKACEGGVAQLGEPDVDRGPELVADAAGGLGRGAGPGERLALYHDDSHARLLEHEVVRRGQADDAAPDDHDVSVLYRHEHHPSAARP